MGCQARDEMNGRSLHESPHLPTKAADRPPSQRPEGFDDIGPSAVLRRTVEIAHINAPFAPCSWANLVKTRSRILGQRLPRLKATRAALNQQCGPRDRWRHSPFLT